MDDSPNTDTFSAPGLTKAIEHEVYETSAAMRRAIRNGFNHLDARPPFAEFEQRVLEQLNGTAWVGRVPF